MGTAALADQPDRARTTAGANSRRTVQLLRDASKGPQVVFGETFAVLERKHDLN
jgi:hypothetical protein